MQDLVEQPPMAVEATAMVGLVRQAEELALRSKAPGTIRVYQSVWRSFCAWCTTQNVRPEDVDPRMLASYIADISGSLSASSIRVTLAGIKEASDWAGVSLQMDHPFLTKVVAGVMRSQPARAKRQATAATPDILRKMVAACPATDTALGARNRAILLLNFAAALRRSEVAALCLGDVTRVAGRGINLLIRRSKTDQTGLGAVLPIAVNSSDAEFCPVVALERWLEHRCEAGSDPDAPLFCAMSSHGGRVTEDGISDKTIVRVIKAAAERSGLDADSFSGHSMRRGFLTAAARSGASLPDLMRHARHKTTSVAISYIEEANAWEGNLSERVLTSA